MFRKCTTQNNCSQTSAIPFNLYMDAANTITDLSEIIPGDPETIDFIRENYKELIAVMVLLACFWLQKCGAEVSSVLR